MSINKNMPRLFLFISLILCAALTQADTGSVLAFSWDPGSVGACPAFSEHHFPENEHARWQTAGYGPGLGETGLVILAGVAGNVIGIYVGGYLGFIIQSGAIPGGLAGSVCGSTLGVYFAGSTLGRNGNFGAALAGSMLGEVAALALALAIPGEEFPFLTGFLILPPIGAALGFNSSLRSRSSRAGSGLLNLAEGKLGLGVPDFQVRPSFVPGLKAKPELRFNLRVLSVEL